MSAQPRAQLIGAVLIGAALVGAVVIAVFPSPVARRAAVVPPAGADSQRPAPGSAVKEASSIASDSAPLPLPPARDTVASPLDSAATDSAWGSCVMRAKELLSEAARDSSAVEIRTVTGVRPEPGRGPDSLLVEGIAYGRDDTPAVWHCAVTSDGAGHTGKLTAVVEDGWPGVPSAFAAAHAVTMAAENACLEQTKSVYPEYVFRGVRVFRDVDTLNVSGDAIPLNDGDRAGRFHCRAIVRNGRVVRTQARAEQ